MCGASKPQDNNLTDFQLWLMVFGATAAFVCIGTLIGFVGWRAWLMFTGQG